MNRSIDQRILNLDIRWRWEVSFTLRPLYSRGKSRSGRGCEEKILCSYQESNSSRSARYNDWVIPDLCNRFL